MRSHRRFVRRRTRRDRNLRTRGGAQGGGDWTRGCHRVALGDCQCTARGTFDRLTDQDRILDTVEESLRAETEGVENQLERVLSNVNDQIDTIEADVRQTESIARIAEDAVANTTRELRDDVYALEERVNDTLREVDVELREIREELENRIQQMLDNPLNDSE